jgi:hypothetical protein
MDIPLALRKFFEQTVEDYNKLNQEKPVLDPGRLGQILGWFEIYAIEFANLDLVEELTISHFEEYFSFWYLRKVGEKSPADALDHLSGIKLLLAWFAKQDLLEFDAELKQTIESLQPMLPRLLQLAHTIRISIDDETPKKRLEPLLPLSVPPVLSSLFQVKSKLNKPVVNPPVENLAEPGCHDPGYCCSFYDLHNRGPVSPVQIPAQAWLLIQTGDILELTLHKLNHVWQITGSGSAYPNLAARYLFK